MSQMFKKIFKNKGQSPRRHEEKEPYSPGLSSSGKEGVEAKVIKLFFFRFHAVYEKILFDL